MKKTISFALVLVLCLSFALTGCTKDSGDDVSFLSYYEDVIIDVEDEGTGSSGSSDKTSSDDKKTSTGKTDSTTTIGGATGGSAMDSLKSYNLKGYKFTIATFDIPKAGVNDYQDAVLARNARVEKKLNCKIIYEYYDPATFFSVASAAIMAGDKVADVMEYPMHNMGSFINAQLLYDVNDLKYLDMKSDAWDQVGFTNTTLASGTYGLLGPITNWRNGGAIWYNKKLVKQMNLGDPQEHVTKGTWTWSTFKTMVSKAMKDLDNDGNYTLNDQWACTTNRYDGLYAFFGSSGNNTLVVKDKKYVYNLDSTKGMESLVELKNMLAIPGGVYSSSVAYDDHKNFEAGKFVFFLFDGCSIPVDTSKIDVGIVPFPKGNNASTYVSNVGHNAKIMAIPITIPDPDKTGLILQYLATEAEAGNEREVFRKYMTSQYPTQKDVEIYNKYIYPNVAFDPAMLFKAMNLSVYNATEVVIGNPIILDQANYTAAGLIEQYKDACVKFMNTINTK